jgi:hypothetical protein
MSALILHRRPLMQMTLAVIAAVLPRPIIQALQALKMWV